MGFKPHSYALWFLYHMTSLIFLMQFFNFLLPLKLPSHSNLDNILDPDPSHGHCLPLSVSWTPWVCDALPSPQSLGQRDLLPGSTVFQNHLSPDLIYSTFSYRF